MGYASPHASDRQRAPSKRALKTKTRILDAAERLFAQCNFEGASLRHIASEAGVPVALVSFHCGSKEDLFYTVVARRAGELSVLRLQGLADLKNRGTALTARDILECSLLPHLDKVMGGGPQWLAYVRLVALVSTDPRWHKISEACFDPTATRFLDELSAIYPDADKAGIAAAYMFSVSAMLSLCTSVWRIKVLSKETTELDLEKISADMIDFCAAGLQTVLAAK